MSEKRLCGFKFCSSGMEPTRQPVVTMSAFGRNAPSADLVLGMALCEPCAAKARPDDFITDSGWAVMQDTFYKAFRRNPVRASLKVRFQDFISVQDYVEQQKALQAEQTRKAAEELKRRGQDPRGIKGLIPPVQ